MVSKIISLLQNNKKRITITCLSSNSEMINFIFYSQLFFPFTIIKWNKLDSNIRCSPSYKLFRKRILECIRTHPSSVFIIPNSLLLTYLTRLRVVICMNINFVIILRIHLTQFVTAAMLLSQLSTNFFTAQISRIKAVPPAKFLELLTQISYP